MMWSGTVMIQSSGHVIMCGRDEVKNSHVLVTKQPDSGKDTDSTDSIILSREPHQPLTSGPTFLQLDLSKLHLP